MAQASGRTYQSIPSRIQTRLTTTHNGMINYDIHTMENHTSVNINKTVTNDKVDKSLTHNVEFKQQDMKEYILSDSSCLKKM